MLTFLIVHGIHHSNLLNRVCVYPVAGRRPYNAEKTDCHVANMRVQTIAADIQILVLLRRQPASLPVQGAAQK